MKLKIFDEEDKKILIEDLDKLKEYYVNLLEVDCDDEVSRYRLFVIVRLKNVIEQKKC